MPAQGVKAGKEARPAGRVSPKRVGPRVGPRPKEEAGPAGAMRPVRVSTERPVKWAKSEMVGASGEACPRKRAGHTEVVRRRERKKLEEKWPETEGPAKAAWLD